MQYDFAPLEGLTDSIYRGLHHTHFPGVHRYYTPFFSPTIHRSLTPREKRELPPADSLPFAVVPQILTKVSDDFLWMAQQCADAGYREVNLNIGCPSGTVVSKGKGAGMLSDPDGLDRFLDAIFSAAPLPVSIKTRIGVQSQDEFPRLLEIFNRYPVQELIVHPRVRKDFYNDAVRMDAFAYAVANTTIPLCYNGNLCTAEDIARLTAQFPSIHGVMLGRGLIGDPGMLSVGGTTACKLEAFFEDLLEAYLVAFGGSRNAMFRLKENWRYLLCRFEGSERLGKRLRKTTDLAEYRSITREIFHTLPLRPQLQADW